MESKSQVSNKVSQSSSTSKAFPVRCQRGDLGSQELKSAFKYVTVNLGMEVDKGEDDNGQGQGDGFM